MFYTSYEVDWCRGNTVDLFLVDACSSLGQVISYPDGGYYSLSEYFLEIVRRIPPLAQHFKIVSITSVILQFDCV
jgi:hypothetical protein